MTAARIVEYGYYPGVLVGSLVLGFSLLSLEVDPGVVLAVCGLTFAFLCFFVERRFAETTQWRLDPGEAWADALHAVLSNPIPTAILRVTLATLVIAIADWLRGRFGLGFWPDGWPLLAQFALALVLVEAVSYAIHRGLHRSGLWPLHAVHHCSPRMYFLLSVRKHPLQSFVTYGGRFSLLWFLGVPSDALTLLLVFTGANSYVQHSNIRMNTRALSYVFATPELHRLHHSRRPSELDTNFGDVLIVWDVVFGTRRAPVVGDDLHDVIGLPGIEVPQTYASHLMLPFRWRSLQESRAGG